MLNRRRTLSLGLSTLIGARASWAVAQPARPAANPVLIGIDGEFGLANSTSAQAVELGARIAAAEVNRSGGVLGGRPLELVTKDHRSVPARGIKNIREFVAMPDLVAVLGGRFSPVIIEQIPLLREAGLPFLAVWSSADAIVENGSKPNYVFRLSLRDGLAMPFMLENARQRNLRQVGLLLTNTSWGRSSLSAAEKHVKAPQSVEVVGTAWYNWQEPSIVDKYLKLHAAGAKVIVLVANDDEAALLVREVASLPANKRVPIISHWGVTGGEFFSSAGASLKDVDFTVIQTFSFFRASKTVLPRFMASAREFKIGRIEDIHSPVGVAHAYDMVHILARAIDQAGSTDRSGIRNALEKLPAMEGLIKRYAPPFTAARHEALDGKQLLMARYREDGVLVPVSRSDR